VCVEFIYPRPPETIIAFIDPLVWNLFTIHLMMAIGLYNTTHSYSWGSLLAAGVEECKKADKQEVIDCKGEFLNVFICGKSNYILITNLMH